MGGNGKWEVWKGVEKVTLNRILLSVWPWLWSSTCPSRSDHNSNISSNQRRNIASTMTLLTVDAEYGYVVAVALLLYIQQSIIFAIPVALARRRTGIKPPVLYPNDSLIKSLKLTDEQVDSYNRTQRVHQNNMEFLHSFFPIFLLSGLYNPVHAAIAGAVVFAGRMVTAIGYWHNANSRIFGGWWHFGEFYCLYMVGMFAYNLLTGN